MSDQPVPHPPRSGSLEVRTVDYHAGGEPFRIVTGGVADIEGATILEKRRWTAANLDHVRQLLVNEPRGHADMYGCFVVEPDDDGADLGVLFFHNEGYSTACGHGTIALVTWALESGRLPMTGPETLVSVDVPSGRLACVARCDTEAGRVLGVRFRNVPSFVLADDVTLATSAGPIRAGVAYGGAFYGSVDVRSVGLAVDRASLPRLIALQRELRPALDAALDVVHPERAGAARHLRDHLLAGRADRGRGPRDAHAAQRDGLRGWRGGPLAVRERDLGAPRDPPRAGTTSCGRGAPPPEHRRFHVHGPHRRHRRGGWTVRGDHRGGGTRPPDRAPRLHPRPGRSHRDRLPSAVSPVAPIADATRATALPMASTWDHRRTTAGQGAGGAAIHGEGAT